MSKFDTAVLDNRFGISAAGQFSQLARLSSESQITARRTGR